MTAAVWDDRIVKRAAVPPAQLLANPKNYRRHTRDQKAAFRALVAEVGYIDPVLCQLDGTVIDGHLRVEVALEDGIATIPVDYYDGTPEQSDLILASKDPLAAMAYHDEAATTALLDELGRDHETALQALLDSLRSEPATVAGLTDPDDVPAVPSVPVTQPGDLWLLGRHRLLCGDATAVTDVERLMDGERADMVFTDPPYGVGYDGGTKIRALVAGDEEGSSVLTEAMPMIASFSDHQAPLYLWHADPVGMPVLQALALNGYELRSLIVWNKNQAQFGALSAQYKQKHEPCFYAFKRGCSPYWYGPTNEVTVWDADRAPRNDLHPTQKPVELAERAIGNSSKPTDLILDLFGGSGSTLIACEQTGRRCAMLEIDPHYCDVIVQRWERFAGGTATLADHAMAAD